MIGVVLHYITSLWFPAVETLKVVKLIRVRELASRRPHPDGRRTHSGCECLVLSISFVLFPSVCLYRCGFLWPYVFPSSP